MINKEIIDNKINKKNPLLPKKPNSPLLENEDDEEDSESKADGGSKIKYLPPSVMKDIEQKNAARKLAGLPSIVTRIRRCLTCGSMFQSAGNRTCGCASRVAGIIAGREII